MSPTLRQAGCVAIGGRGLLIEGPPGSGKSSLALALIDRGALLVGDDGVRLEVRENRLWAEPPPNTAGLIEIRNVGLVRMVTASAPVALLVRHDANAPRYVEAAEGVPVMGQTIPMIRMDFKLPVLALRAEWALRQFGTV